MSHTMSAHAFQTWAERKSGWSRTSQRLWTGVYRHLERASKWVALRRARRELLNLPDYMLADIGISRSEVETAVRYGRPDPARPLRG